MRSNQGQVSLLEAGGAPACTDDSLEQVATTPKSCLHDRCKDCEFISGASKVRVSVFRHQRGFRAEPPSRCTFRTIRVSKHGSLNPCVCLIPAAYRQELRRKKSACPYHWKRLQDTARRVEFGARMSRRISAAGSLNQMLLYCLFWAFRPSSTSVRLVATRPKRKGVATMVSGLFAERCW